ncbi:MAG: hypothetical protein C0404_05655 [Verrucomicrobia bacterium]|nr:hypothetical protein [Verrucomicrobiota bacterium]
MEVLLASFTVLTVKIESPSTFRTVGSKLSHYLLAAPGTKKLRDRDEQDGEYHKKYDEAPKSELFE